MKLPIVTQDARTKWWVVVECALISLAAVAGVVGCSGDSGPNAGVVPSDFQVDYRWDSGVSNVGPDYVSYRISLPPTGPGTIHYTIGHPSTSQQEDWVETFGIAGEDVRALYALIHEAGLFTRAWPQSDPVPGANCGSSVRVVADGTDYQVPTMLADPDDADSIAAVYETIRSMVPETIWEDFEARQVRYLSEHSP